MDQRYIQESKEGGEQGESKLYHRPCSVFPDDILKLIFSRLDWVDRIHMRTVCKDWLRLMNEIPYQLQDCIFFIFKIKEDRSMKALISICRIGDKKWKKLKFPVPGEFKNDIYPWQNWEVAYVNGGFYTVSATGLVGVFDVKLQEWKLLTSSSQFGNAHSCYAIVSQEQLFMVGNVQLDSSWMVWRFDTVQKQWVEEEKCNWKNRVIFLGCTTFFAEAVGELSTHASIYKCYIPNYSSSLSSEFYFNHSLYGKVISKPIFGRTWVQPPMFLDHQKDNTSASSIED
ncbi:hypothetical protein GH714_008474 [Hevea brasiliensis]|uniref:F-box domain-containing protein n=1 Tax=Hevea brasiliensis TaxID=3981 RepID=A0A6A6LJ17_HEVBR|nr:hypothetical protein GH714_008474 [Hevea brasiliensis]